MDPTLKLRVDAIEECYEFMLAYAAQGIVEEPSAVAPSFSPVNQSGQLRTFLGRAEEALTGLGDAYRSHVQREQLEPSDRYLRFIDVLDRDARDALAAVQLVLAQASISSQVIDNLNASIHLRALLTDLFLIDEVLKGSRDRGSGIRDSIVPGARDS